MSRNHEDIPVLVGQSGPLNGQRWTLQGSIMVGRDESCDIVVPSRQVSRKHACFSLTSRGVLLEDLTSKNGTHYNGELINTPTLLKDGDIIQIAFTQQFLFISSDATLPLEMVVETIAHPTLKGNLRLDKRACRTWIKDKELVPPLSASQFNLLNILYEQAGRVVVRKEIIASVWGEEKAVEVSEQALDALVRRLRDRLATLDPTHDYIVTVRGHGLRLENPPR